MTLPLRPLLLSCSLLLALLAPAHSASARGFGFQRYLAGYIGAYAPGRFVGQVSALAGPASNPTGMTIALGVDTVDIRFGLRYTPKPMSAEAEVEGLALHDYVALEARRVRGAWITQRVNYDVQPFGRLKLFLGTVVNVTPDGKHLRLRLADTGAVRWLVVDRQARYEIDGHPASSAMPLTRDDIVQVLVLRTDFNWVATDINLKTTTLGMHALTGTR